MSYQVIARKWRPLSFDDVTGQSHVTTPLRNAIRSGRIPHALLLTGPRGVGKTTLARILARCLNCEKGPTDEPCGTCAFCEEIIAGRATDVQEIDAASRTGVDDIREVIEAIRYAPTPGKHRIFVVDEVHMLSKQAFNALLKTLEEPPPQSLFVFATTNPEAIPFTVLSRCQRYDLRRIAAQEVARCLGAIAEAEGIEISKPSLLALAREGDGSMRDSQTLLDQVISFGGSRVDDEVVRQVLDLIDRNLLVSIVKACVDSDPKAVLEACALAADKGNDPKRLGASLIQLLRDLVVLSIAPDAADELVDASDEDQAELIALAKQSNTPRLRRMFRILVSEQEDLAWAPQPFAVLEMALVRLASLPEGGDIAQLVARLEALEAKLGPGGGGGATGAGGAGGDAAGGAGNRGGGGGSGARSVRKAVADAVPVRAEARAANPTPDHQPEPTLRAVPEPPQDSPVARSAPAETRTPDAREDLDDASSDIEAEPDETSASVSEALATPEAVLDRLRALARDTSLALFHSLERVVLADRGPAHLRFVANSAFHTKRLEDRRAELDALCRHFYGKTMRIEISQQHSEDEAALTGGLASESREKDRQRKHAALNHPSINLALKALRGEIIEIHALDAASKPAKGHAKGPGR